MNPNSRHLTARTRNVLTAAEQTARNLGHTFIGTEHLLIALFEDDSSYIASSLRALGIEGRQIRDEVAKIVTPGPGPIVGGCPLALTPRAGRAIELAGEEAWCVGLEQTDSEHLLLGLLREPDGVAGTVLRNLGAPFEQLRRSLLRIRIEQMQIVERAVRPVRARIAKKRKMREELLAHLTGVYDEQLSHASDPRAALREAARRLGSPADLARELDAALPHDERFSYYIERFFGWHAPETAAKWLLRLAAYLFLFLVVIVFGSLAVAAVVAGGFDFIRASELRRAIAFAIFTPPALITCGLLYFRIRDSIFGIFGARRSRWNVLGWQLLMIASIMLLGTAHVALAEWNLLRALQFLLRYVVAGAATAITLTIAARLKGFTEYSDALWELLDLNDGAVAE